MIVGTAAALMAAALVGIPRLRRSGGKRAVVVYVALFVMVAVVAFIYVSGAVVYGPLEGMMHFVRHVLGVSLRALGGEMDGTV